MTTDTKPLAPTDIDIDALWVGQQLTVPQLVQRRVIARAVLAKWGKVTPATVGVEPIGYLYCGGSYGDELADWEIVADQCQCDKLNEHHGALGKEARLPIYTTPQPTQPQAGAVPLTDEAVDLLCKVGPVYTLDGKVTRTPQQYRDELEAAQRYGLRKGERAHGIKGGQHGTE